MLWHSSAGFSFEMFTLLYTGVVPIIRSPRGNAAKAVAEALDKKIRDNLRDTDNSMFSGDNIPVAQLRWGRSLVITLRFS